MSGSSAGGRVYKRIGESHVVWFAESNRWVEFREPAWLVYAQKAAGAGVGEIAAVLRSRYGLPEKDATRFCREILQGIEDATSPLAGPDDGKTDTLPEMPQDRLTTRHYSAGGKKFSICYGSPFLERLVHLPLAHTESRAPSGPLIIMISEDPVNPTMYHLRVRNPAEFPDKLYRFNDAGVLKQTIYISIASYLYDMHEEEWMAYIHASAVTGGKEALLLCSSSGSGKSTMAALLQHKAQKNPAWFISDDFVAVAAGDLRAYTFPAAITIKRGSMDLIRTHYQYPEEFVNGDHYRGKGKVWYLHPRFPERDPFSGREIKNIVFLRYDPSVSFSLEKAGTLEALAEFHDQAWISRIPGHAQQFIDWFVGVSFYRLTYSDSPQALEEIRKLIK